MVGGCVYVLLGVVDDGEGTRVFFLWKTRLSATEWYVLLTIRYP